MEITNALLVAMMFIVLLQLWIIGVDILLSEGFTRAGIFNLIGAALFGTLAFVKRPNLHRAGMIGGWLLFLMIILARGLRWIG